MSWSLLQESPTKIGLFFKSDLAIYTHTPGDVCCGFCFVIINIKCKIVSPLISSLSVFNTRLCLFFSLLLIEACSLVRAFIRSFVCGQLQLSSLRLQVRQSHVKLIKY